MYVISSNLQKSGKFKEALKVVEPSIVNARIIFGENNIKFVQWLNLKGACYAQLGKYEEAENYLISAQGICKNLKINKTIDYGQVLNNLGTLYFLTNRDSLAEIAALEARNIFSQSFVESPVDYLQTLNNLGLLKSRSGRLKEGLVYFEEAKKVFETSNIGTENIRYALLLNNISNIISEDYTKFDEVENLLTQAKSIALRVGGSESPQYLLINSNFGRYYVKSGKYELAEEIYLEVKKIREKLFGKEHDTYGKSVNALANLYSNYLAKYELAEPLYLEGIEILRKKVGDADPSCISAKLNLANLYNIIGKENAAELLLLENIKTIINHKGKKNSDYVSNTSVLANMWRSSGRYVEAKPLLQEALSILTEMDIINNPLFGGALVNLGNLYTELNQYDSAKFYYMKSLQIFEKMENYKAHPFYLNSHSSLAALHALQLDFPEAKKWYEKNIAMRLESQDTSNPEYIYDLSSLGFVETKLKNYVRAEQILKTAENLYDKSIGRGTNDFANILDNLIALYYQQNYTQFGLSYLKELCALREKFLQDASKYMTEKELEKYILNFENHLDKFYSYLLLQGSDTDLKNWGMDIALFYKGWVMLNVNQLKNLINSDTLATYKYGLLRPLLRRLASEYTNPSPDRSSILKLEEMANASEKYLTRYLSKYEQLSKPIQWKNLQEKLILGEAAIEIVHFKITFPSYLDSIIYAALILRPGDSSPIFIPLFEEKQLQLLLTKNIQSESLSQLYTSRGATPIKAESLHGLYNLIWKPLDSILQNTNTIYYSPSGLLHQINFAAIPLDERTNLSDKFKLVRLGSTRSLVIPDLIKVDSSNQVVVFGGIDYNIDTTIINLDTMSPEVFASKDEELSFTYVERGISERENAWGYLSGTEREINGISKLFKKSKFSTTAFSGKYATEESFKNLGRSQTSPRVLHIATHGFFFPDPKSNSHESTVSSQTESVFKMSDHPMIPSGLILAGGNYAWKEGKPFKEGMEDGILTAYEISQMNLSNTELVVLSACDTGLGDIQGNEGVYGLQRAFKIAGAKYLIMSLWQVPDKQTSLLMTTFYKKWLEDKMSIPDAFHAAQKQLRDGGLEPYYWAGFVLVE